MKTKVFIASSVKSLSVAESIQRNLEHEFEVTIWSQSIFDLSAIAIESLVKAAENNPFGVFVFGEDDKVELASGSTSAARDNVIFELGLFTGRRGRTNVFIVRPRGVNLHIPSDLGGITTADYDPNRSDGNLDAALGSACTQIKRQINSASIIEYPLAGRWGMSVLSAEVSRIEATRSYTLAAKLTNNQSLKLRLNALGPGPECWCMNVAGLGGWTFDAYDADRKEQYFYLTGPANGDCQISFQQGANVSIEYFENGSEKATSQRRLTVI